MRSFQSNELKIKGCLQNVVRTVDPSVNALGGDPKNAWKTNAPGRSQRLGEESFDKENRSPRGEKTPGAFMLFWLPRTHKTRTLRLRYVFFSNEVNRTSLAHSTRYQLYTVGLRRTYPWVPASSIPQLSLTALIHTNIASNSINNRT